MPRSNILVAVIDGLRASTLGAYGNTTFSTPALDEFAAGSMLFDSCFSPTDDIVGLYSSLWRSIHPARFSQNAIFDSHAAASAEVLPKLLADRGYCVSIVTDEALLTQLFGWESAHEHESLENTLSTAVPHRATDVLETELARLFAVASDLICNHTPTRTSSSDSGRPQLVWLHARGMYGAWDAPLELQSSLRDESDPPLVESAESPDVFLAGDDDPDAIFRYASAYAAQTMALDTCWKQLIDSVDATRNEAPWLITLIGARGFPLGEHGRIGGIDSRLYSEQLHVPWLIRFPDGRERLTRESKLTTHTDVLPTLLDWIGVESDDSSRHFDGLSALPLRDSTARQSRDTMLSVARNSGNKRHTIRTANWYLLDTPARPEGSTAESSTALAELFVKPDDRWDANDVSKLCPLESGELRAVGEEMLRRYTDGGHNC